MHDIGGLDSVGWKQRNLYFDLDSYRTVNVVTELSTAWWDG